MSIQRAGRAVALLALLLPAACGDTPTVIMVVPPETGEGYRGVWTGQAGTLALSLTFSGETECDWGFCTGTGRYSYADSTRGMRAGDTQMRYTLYRGNVTAHLDVFEVRVGILNTETLAGSLWTRNPATPNSGQEFVAYITLQKN